MRNQDMVEILQVDNDNLRRKLALAQQELAIKAQQPEGEVLSQEGNNPQPELLQRLRRPASAPVRRRRVPPRMPKPIKTERIEERYAAQITVLLNSLREAVEEQVLPEYEGWVDASKERLPTFKQDEPTEAQIKAGNYPKKHIRMHGFDISIENKKGSIRSGKNKGGKKWSVRMAHDYGYIRHTEGADGDHLDVFIGPKLKSEKVFVVYQVDPGTKRFDEHKVMFGFSNQTAAKAGYLANYEKGWQGIGKIVELSVDAFKEWLDEEDLRTDAVRNDDEFELIYALFNRIRMGILERETAYAYAARMAAQAAAAATNEQNKNYSNEVMERVLRVDPFRSEPWLLPESRNWVQENVGLIKSVGHSYLGDVEKLIYSMVREGVSIKDVRKELASRFGVSRSRARLIARDQVNKYNGRLTQARQMQIGVSEYTWKTVEDVRVRGAPGGKYPNARPSHWIMEGVKCRWDDPTVYHNGKKWVKRTQAMPKEHPGQPIQDRCFALAVLDKLLE